MSIKMIQKENRYDVFANLVGVFRTPGETNRELFVKSCEINQFDAEKFTSSFIGNYLAKHLKINSFNSKEVSWVILDKSPLYLSIENEVLPLKVYKNNDISNLVPIKRNENVDIPSEFDEYNPDTDAQVLIVFKEDDNHLSRICLTIGFDENDYIFEYQSDTEYIKQSIGLQGTTSYGDLISYDLSEKQTDPLFINDILPTDLSKDIEQTVENISPRRWGNANIDLSISERSLGMSFPSNFDAAIENTERTTSIVLDTDSSTYINSGIEYSSFEIVDSASNGNNITLWCNPGIWNYRNVKLFIGSKRFYIKEPGETYFEIDFADAHPIDILNITSICDVSEINGKIQIPAHFSDNITFEESDYTEYVFPQDTSMFSIGIPLEINQDGSTPNAGSTYYSVYRYKGYTYSISNGKLRITVPNASINNTEVYVACLPTKFKLNIPVSMWSQAMLSDFEIGIGAKSDTLKNFYSYLTTNVLAYPSVLIIPTNKNSMAIGNISFDVEIRNNDTMEFLAITDSVHETNTTLRTNSNDNGIIEVRILEDISTVNTINIKVNMSGSVTSITKILSIQ